MQIEPHLQCYGSGAHAEVQADELTLCGRLLIARWPAPVPPSVEVAACPHRLMSWCLHHVCYGCGRTCMDVCTLIPSPPLPPPPPLYLKSETSRPRSVSAFRICSTLHVCVAARRVSSCASAPHAHAAPRVTGASSAVAPDIQTALCPVPFEFMF